MSDSYNAAIAARSEARKARGLTPDDSDAAFRVPFDVRAQMQERSHIAGDAVFKSAMMAALKGDDVVDVKRAAWNAAEQFSGEE